MPDLRLIVPARDAGPSGGDIYDAQLARAWDAEHGRADVIALPGRWPRPGPEERRSLSLALHGADTVVLDGLLGSAAAFEQADVLVSPTAPTTAFRIGDKMQDPMAMYLNDIATIPANLAGIPGMSIPSGLAEEDGLPVGVQILAPAMEDQRLYAVGAALEEALRLSQGGYVFEKAPEIEVRS